MADAPLHVEVVAGERSVEPKVKDLATRVHDIAERGREQRDPAQWPSTYGKFLQTCATCHQALGVGKPAPE
jgi:mono/diheme cytochrome c family protein